MTGYDSKRQMAVDKVQEPVANSFEEYCNTLPPLWNTHISRTYAEQFFRAGQAAQPAQEPVAWEQFYPDIGKNQLAYLPPSPFDISGNPQQRTWVGLTDEERNDCLVEADPCECLADPEAHQLMVEVEAKLRSKNNG